ncbi:MAG: YraN family protein [Hyphomonadaceae bacterium]|nr:YraN family protein [Hyphomonadaceae bacterium]
MTAARRRAERSGRLAEWAAAFWLMAKGYRLLGRRLRTPFGEVDLAFWKGGVLVIVEVKRRRRITAGLEAVGPHQQGRLARAALALAQRWRLSRAPIRFDVVVVGAGALPHHVRAAWTA